MLFIFITLSANTSFLLPIITASKYIGAGLATLGLAGAAVGIGVVFAGLMLAFARTPGEKSEIFRYAILGFALTEAMGLISLMLSLMMLYS